MIRSILDLPAGAGEQMTWSSEDSDNEEVRARTRARRALAPARVAALTEETLEGLPAAPIPAPAPAPRAPSRVQACGWRDVYRCRNRVADHLGTDPEDEARIVQVSLSQSGADGCQVKTVMRPSMINVAQCEDAHGGLTQPEFALLFFSSKNACPGLEADDSVGLVGIVAQLVATDCLYVIITDAADGDVARFLAHAAVMRIKRKDEALGVQIRRTMQYDDLGGQKPARSGLAALLARLAPAANELDERRRVRAYLESIATDRE